MIRHLKILLFGMVVIGLMASGAWAGNIAYLGSGAAVNTTFSVALEAMNAARNMTMTGGANVANVVTPALYITPGQGLPSGSFVTISFTNAGFDGSTVYLCEVDGTTFNANGAATPPVAPVASTAPSANATSKAFVLGRGVAGTNKIMVTTSANATNCVNDGGFILRFQPVSSAAMASVSYTVGSVSGCTGDACFDTGTAPNNVANISRQFVTNYVQGNSIIDFAGNAASNGAKLLTAGLAATNAAIAGQVAINYTAANVQTAAVGTTNAGLTVSAILSLQDSASWQGVQRVYVFSGGTPSTCTLGSNNAINNAPSGTVSLAIPTTVWSGAATLAATMCADVKGNQAIQTRAIKGSWDITVGTGGNDPAADAFTALMSWLPNGYQGIIPYIYGGSAYTTMCMINNKSTATAPVTVDILTSESGATLTSLASLSVGTLAAGGTMRVNFDASITPYTYSGGVESAGTAIALTGIQSNDRYSAMVNVGASPTQITINCLQSDPAGARRAVPVLTQNVSTYTWQQ